MINVHLAGVGLWALRPRHGKVRDEIFQSRSGRTDQLSAEPIEHRAGRSFGAACIIVQENKCDVVPIFGLTTCIRCRGLREEKACQAGDVDLYPPNEVAYSRCQLMYYDIARGEARAAQVHGAEGITAIEVERRLGWCIVAIGKQLELDYRRRTAAVSICSPAPGLVRIGLEFGIAERTLQPCGVHSPVCDLEIHLDIDIRGTGMAKAAPRTEQFGHETTKQDELGARAIVMDNPDQRLLGGESRRATSRGLITHA